MRVLLIGGGGREHALAWKIRQSPEVEALYCAPGNAGIARVAECIKIGADDTADLVNFARSQKIDLTVVGPEGPLASGLVDRLQGDGQTVFGPTRSAARMESSKAFAKRLLQKYKIPTADFHVFDDFDKAAAYVKEADRPLVVKADGLALGKGVSICRDAGEALAALETMMAKRAFGDAGLRVVIEEFLTGEELTVFAFVDGRTILPLPACQDYKRAYDGDKGPNTGGMGSYSPVPSVSDAKYERIVNELLLPTVHALHAERIKYQGVLYTGILWTRNGPKVLEFNARFGDPETQPLMMRFQGDLVPILHDVARGKLKESPIQFDPRAAVCVVACSKGYPGSYEKGKPISGLEEAGAAADVQVFHAGTELRDGQAVTAGGRVLGVTALGKTHAEARRKAYEAVGKVSYEGIQYRKDIADFAARPRGEAV